MEGLLRALVKEHFTHQTCQHGAFSIYTVGVTPCLRRLKILLVDDNAADVSLFDEAFRAMRLHHELQIARNGAEAMTLLTAKRSVGRLPALILLDLHMPEMDGFEVLIAIRNHPNLRTIPVIVLTSSDQEGDVYRAYELGANAYLCKPAKEFVDLLGDLDRFWLRRVQLPSQQLADEAE